MRHLTILLLALLAPWAAAEQVSNAFTATGTGTYINLPQATIQAIGNYVITGTFVATLQIQYNTDNQPNNWTTIATYTGTQSATNFAAPGWYRWICSDFTSGTATCVINTGYQIYQQQKGPSGVLLFQVDAGGVTNGGIVTNSGTNTFSGATSFTNTTSASSATTGAVKIGNGTAATSVGIGGGNVNAGGTIIAGGALSSATTVASGTTLTAGTSLAVTTTANIAGTTASVTPITGTLKVGNGTAATNVGIGGGSIYAGNVLNVGGGAASNNAAIVITAYPLTGANQWGAVYAFTGNSSGTTSLRGSTTALVSGTAAYTVGMAAGHYVFNTGVGAGSTITRSYGMFSETQTGGSTANCGYYYGASTPAAGNWAFYDDAGHKNYLGTAATLIGTTTDDGTNKLQVAGPSALGTIGATFVGNTIAGVQSGAVDVAGAVGEVIQGTNQASYTNFTAANTLQQLAVLTSLPPGRYEITGIATYYGNGATVAALNEAQFAISTTTASTAGAVEGRSIGYVTEQITSSLHQTVTITTDVNISAATSYFLNGKAQFTVGNPQYVASLTAVRIR